MKANGHGDVAGLALAAVPVALREHSDPDHDHTSRATHDVADLEIAVVGCFYHSLHVYLFDRILDFRVGLAKSLLDYWNCLLGRVDRAP